jgi:hypothetical protein
MTKKSLLGPAFAAALAFAPTGADATAFPIGWNLAVVTDCQLTPGDATATPPTVDELLVSLTLVTSTTVPPPPITGSFTSSNENVITVLAPVCASGAPFFFFWNGSKVTSVAVAPSFK